MDTLAAICDILGCTPGDLIEVEAVNAQVRKTADGAQAPGNAPGPGGGPSSAGPGIR